MGLMIWVVLAGYGVFLWYLSPWSQDNRMFYQGTDRSGNGAGYLLLTGSIFVTWIFAKSITNAANLGASFGIMGGVAYAGWYLSIPVAGLVIYGLRKRYDVTGLVQFLIIKYGRYAALAFMVAIFIRLFNEIWSNTMVVGTYFGGMGTGSYYVACISFTGVTLAYSLRGGLRSSLITDMIQVALMVFFIVLVLGFIVPENPGTLMTAGELSMAGGLDLFLVAVLQSLSYPFHDPVLTDRGFITDRKTTLKSYFTAGGLGIACIIVFSLVGVYAFVEGMEITEDAPPAVASAFGTTVFFVMNIIMMTSAGSTLDSTFSSLSREFGVDLPSLTDWYESQNVTVGRVVMVLTAIFGTLPIFTGVTILEATTISGTMVMGLAPIFLFYWWDRPGAVSFHLAFWTGLGFGFWEVFGRVPGFMQIGDGTYAGLLAINAYGLVTCTLLYLMGALISPRRQN